MLLWPLPATTLALCDPIRISADLISIKAQIHLLEVEIAGDPIRMTLGWAITGSTCRNRWDYV